MAEASSGLGEAAFAPALKDLFKIHLGEERDKPPPTPDSWMRVSSLASLCAREEVLVAKENLVRKDKVNPDLATIFAHGHALHWAFQNIVLPGVGVLRGKWICTYCGSKYGVPEGDQSVVDAAVPRPSKCSACRHKDEFLFEEYDLSNVEYKLTGHSDGFLEMDGLPGLGVFEGKSINPRGAWEVRGCPKMDHVIQAQCYMWLTDLQWGKIVYWDKSGVGMGAFIEHHIERDEETIDGVKELLETIRAGISKKELPAKICETPRCKRAGMCAVKKICFARD